MRRRAFQAEGTMSGKVSMWLKNSRETSVTITEGAKEDGERGPDPIEPRRTLQYLDFSH